MHWSDQYVRAGLIYQEHVFDCASLVEKIRREVFRHDLHLPSDRSANGPERAAEIAHNLADYAVPTYAPIDGDGVLLITRGRLQHIGVYCLIDNEPWVIHCIEAWNVNRMRVRDLIRWYMRAEGFYSWI